jgi:hypothetical protein
MQIGHLSSDAKVHRKESVCVFAFISDREQTALNLGVICGSEGVFH